jgi:hypothetical protein
MTVATGSNLMYEAGRDMETESNFELTRGALAPNLKLIESLGSQAPNNRELLLTLTKGYTALAFVVNETDMFEEEWSGKKSEDNKRQALKNYTKAMNFGLHYLETKDVHYAELFSNTQATLDKNLSSSLMDVESVVFTAQAIGGMINLQKDNMTLVAQLPIVKIMFDWACSKKPDINFGTCDIFYGAYESGRPKMLGGNPEKGKEYFLKAMEKYPHNWLVKTSYIQYYLVPMSDEEGFAKEMSALEKINKDFESFSIYSPQQVTPIWNQEPHQRIYQSLALKRYELLNRYRKQLF